MIMITKVATTAITTAIIQLLIIINKTRENNKLDIKHQMSKLIKSSKLIQLIIIINNIVN